MTYVKVNIVVSKRPPGIGISVILILLYSALSIIILANCCLARSTQNNRDSEILTRSNNFNNKKTLSNPPAAMHPAFQNAGKVKGLQIWRIENFEPVPYPPRDYGKFYSGDSYIILNTKEERDKKLSWDIHFWLGSDTSQDEAGTAAILTVQLDDLLGGAPVQYRQVQEHETSMFHSYFKNGIRYEAGGVGSGFKHVDVNSAGEKRLFQVKGRKNVRVRRVNLSVSSMNKGDCFILDSGNDIYVYFGPQSKNIEKLKATSAANQIRDQDHHGRSRVHTIDSRSTDDEKQNFFKILGSGSPDTVPDDTIAEDDADFEKSHANSIELYKVSDAGGSLKMEKITQKPLRQEMLNTNDCFILDTGSGIYIWTGKRATDQEKRQAMAKGEGFLREKKYPAWTPVQRVIEGGESAPFKQYFVTWRDAGMSHTRLIREINSDQLDGVPEKLDESNLHHLEKSIGSAIAFMPDRGQGIIENIWRIHNFDITELNRKMHGMFYGGDSYIVKYICQPKDGKQCVVLYYWLGRNSTIDEKASAAIHTTRMDNELGGKAIQVRVEQGHEPRHFLKIFQGKLIIFSGGHATTLKNIDDNDTYDENGMRLFCIRGTCEEDVRATQLPKQVASLASDDVFLLETVDTIYLWKGKGSSDFEKDMALKVAKRISSRKNIQTIDENAEPKEFWSSLGGKGEYTNNEMDTINFNFMEPRLFHCILSAKGKIRVEEVYDFEQDDLAIDDVMILDVGDVIFVWIGNDSTKSEREAAFKAANKYLIDDPVRGNRSTTPIIKITQDDEPEGFKRNFPTWNDNLWQST